MIVFWIVFGLFLCFLALLVIRALGFKPKESPPPEPIPVMVEAEAAIRRFRALIQKRTVSYVDRGRMDES